MWHHYFNPWGKGPTLTYQTNVHNLTLTDLTDELLNLYTGRKWQQLYFIPNVVFFLYFNCRAQAFWHFWKHPHALCWNWSQSQHTAIVQFDISMLNTWKKRNNSSTTSLVQHHAQPVEDHACSMRMEELWAIWVVLSSALRWFLICLFESINTSHYVDRVVHCNSRFHQFV